MNQDQTTTDLGATAGAEAATADQGADVWRYDAPDDWKKYLDRIHAGERIEVDQEVFYYFLEVLPPIFMGRTVKLNGIDQRVSYGFAEGSELIKAFWSQGGHYYCQQTTLMNND